MSLLRSETEDLMNKYDDLHYRIYNIEEEFKKQKTIDNKIDNYDKQLFVLFCIISIIIILMKFYNSYNSMKCINPYPYQ